MSYLYSYTHICTYGNVYTTKVQVKTRLASTVQADILPVSLLAALEVLIGEAAVSVAKAVTRYCYCKLTIDNCFFGGAEGGELFCCSPQTGSSRYPLISLQLLVLSIAIITYPL